MIVRSFYFLRHGETDWNAEKRLQGATDIPLNDNGRAQAARAAAILQKYNIDHIVGSPLARAAETARIVADTLQKPLVHDPRIREKNYGQFEGMTLDAIAVWRNENAHKLGAIEPETGYAAPPGGEIYADLRARIMDGFHHWLETHQGKSVLFVSHGGVYRVLRRALLGDETLSPNATPFHFVRETDTAWNIIELT
jgi:broad specificity phosphatase PhoE